MSAWRIKVYVTVGVVCPVRSANENGGHSAQITGEMRTGQRTATHLTLRQAFPSGLVVLGTTRGCQRSGGSDDPHCTQQGANLSEKLGSNKLGTKPKLTQNGAMDVRADTLKI
jgi:hypothetical protein